MRNTITVRLPDDLAEWLTETSQKTGIPQGRIVRQQLEKARAGKSRSFLKLAGSISGPANLSARKGFSKK